MHAYTTPTLTTAKVHTLSIASFSGPAQLFVTCSTEKWGEPGIFSHVSMMKSTNAKKKKKNQNEKAKFHALLNELRVQHLVCIIVAPH